MGVGLGWIRRLGELLRGIFVHNFLLKVLSVLIACGMWFFVNAAQRDSETELSIPVRAINQPAQLILISPRVDEVDLRVSGPRTLLSRIDPAALEVTIDLSRVRPGVTTFRLRSDRLDLPRGVTPIRMTPSELTVEFATTATKRVPVELALEGHPAGGLLIAESKVSPDEVEISGPAATVKDITVAKTVAVDLTDAGAGRMSREVELDVTGEFLTLSTPAVNVELLLQEPVEERKMKALTIVVRNADGEARVVPASIEVEVRGARSKVRGLDLPDGAVFVDASGLGPGQYELTPQIALPTGIELVRDVPAVKVEIAEKPSTETPGVLMTPAQPKVESSIRGERVVELEGGDAG